MIVPPRAGVLSAVGLLVSPRQRELVRSWADARRPRRGGRRSTSLAAEARALVGVDAQVATFVDCRYAGQSHELTVACDRRVPRRARAPQRLRPTGRADRGRGAARPRVAPVADPPGRPPGAVARPRSAGRGSSPSPTARCGCPQGGPRRPARSARGCCDGTAARTRGAIVTLDPAGAAGPRRPAQRRRRRDGRGAAARRVEPQHQGARRLLGRVFTAAGELLAQAEHIPVHLGSMPRVGARGDRRRRRERRPGDQIVCNDPFARRHAPQRRHARRAGARRRRARRLGRQPRAPRRPRRHRARVDAARRARDRRGRAAAAADA